jgi:hypothetical protein
MKKLNLTLIYGNFFFFTWNDFPAAMAAMVFLAILPDLVLGSFGTITT